MLSICIPVYNYNVTKLVKTLHLQAQSLQGACEIICIDDGSTEEFRKMNAVVCQTLGVYIPLEQNIGRAKIRNLFGDYATYDHLLFLDCDVQIPDPTFLQKYFGMITGENQVVCGGISYGLEKPPRNAQLRWKYGHRKEYVPLPVRRSDPYKSFMTGNFMVHRNIFHLVKFDERITTYGHEDTLFGYRLFQHQIPIVHTDNPVLHMNLETNLIFIKKTELGLQNLLKIIHFVDNHPYFTDRITVLKFYRSLEKRHMIPWISLAFRFTKPILRFILASGYTSLGLFDFYKLGFLTVLTLKKT